MPSSFKLGLGAGGQLLKEARWTGVKEASNLPSEVPIGRAPAGPAVSLPETSSEWCSRIHSASCQETLPRVPQSFTSTTGLRTTVTSISTVQVTLLQTCGVTAECVSREGPHSPPRDHRAPAREDGDSGSTELYPHREAALQTSAAGLSGHERLSQADPCPQGRGVRSTSSPCAETCRKVSASRLLADLSPLSSSASPPLSFFLPLPAPPRYLLLRPGTHTPASSTPYLFSTNKEAIKGIKGEPTSVQGLLRVRGSESGRENLLPNSKR